MLRSLYGIYGSRTVEPENGRNRDDEIVPEIEMPLVFTLYEMEQAGIHVEGEALKAYGDQLGNRIVELEKKSMIWRERHSILILQSNWE